MSELDFQIKYIRGKENQVVSALSRSVHLIHLVATSMFKYDIKKRIKFLLLNDEQFNIVKEGLKQEPKRKNYEGYQLTTDVFFMYDNRYYIPNSAKMKNLIMDEFHMPPYVGNPG